MTSNHPWLRLAHQFLLLAEDAYGGLNRRPSRFVELLEKNPGGFLKLVAALHRHCLGPYGLQRGLYLSLSSPGFRLNQIHVSPVCKIEYVSEAPEKIQLLACGGGEI